VSEFTGKKFFTIHPNDGGCDAYSNQYVEWLEQRLAAAEGLLRAAVECGEWFDGTFHVEMNADWLDKAKEVWR
jgi:hypothetical protein